MARSSTNYVSPAQWDVWKEHILKKEFQLAELLSKTYATTKGSRERKTAEHNLACTIYSQYKLLRKKLIKKIGLPNLRQDKYWIAFSQKVENWTPDKSYDLDFLDEVVSKLGELVEKLGYSRVEKDDSDDEYAYG